MKRSIVWQLTMVSIFMAGGTAPPEAGKHTKRMAGKHAKRTRLRQASGGQES